jgi:hypothetical protein
MSDNFYISLGVITCLLGLAIVVSVINKKPSLKECEDSFDIEWDKNIN